MRSRAVFGCLSRVGGQSVRGGDPWEVIVCVFDEHLDRAVPGEVVQRVPEHVLVEERVAPVREEPRDPGVGLVGDHRDDLAALLPDTDPRQRAGIEVRQGEHPLPPAPQETRFGDLALVDSHEEVANAMEIVGEPSRARVAPHCRCHERRLCRLKEEHRTSVSSTIPTI